MNKRYQIMVLQILELPSCGTTSLHNNSYPKYLGPLKCPVDQDQVDMLCVVTLGFCLYFRVCKIITELTPYLR